MDIAKMIKGNLAFTISKIVKGKVNGKKIGTDLDKKLDQTLGLSGSEKIQRGPLTDIFLDILEGIWEENLDAFKYCLQERISKIDGVDFTLTEGKKGGKK